MSSGTGFKKLPPQPDLTQEVKEQQSTLVSQVREQSIIEDQAPSQLIQQACETIGAIDSLDDLRRVEVILKQRKKEIIQQTGTKPEPGETFYQRYFKTKKGTVRGPYWYSIKRQNGRPVTTSWGKEFPSHIDPSKVNITRQEK